MPSWNIHTAHVEALLAEEEPSRLGIRDIVCFQFGNYVPDVYVGYMVKNTTKIIDYHVTHFAGTSAIPVPHHELFWERYIEGQHPSDLVCGVWAHLVADAIYNQATRSFLAARGIGASNETRRMKQADFATFGRTLSIEKHVEATPALIEQAARFPQYAIAEADVRAALEAANGIVEDNQVHHIDSSPSYELLNDAFFRETFKAVHHRILEGLHVAAASN